MQAASNSSEIRLYVIGLGIIIPDHSTKQALNAMSSCVRLYSIVQEPPALWLPPASASPIEVVNVLEMYVEGSLRRENYDRVAKRILLAAEQTGPIGYVTYGNPMAYDSVAQHLAKHSIEAGIPIEIIPGISSVDTILCDIGADMAPGLQVFEASWLMAHEVELRVDTAAILVQVGTFGSLRTRYKTQPAGSSLSELVDYLTRVYPPSHSVSLIQSPNRLGQKARIRTIALGELCNVDSDDLLGGSMYIPALSWPKPNKDVLVKMQQR